MIGDQAFVSTELNRFITNKQDLTVGHQFHSPMHNRFDAIRDEAVYNNINS